MDPTQQPTTPETQPDTSVPPLTPQVENPILVSPVQPVPIPTTPAKKSHALLIILLVIGGLFVLGGIALGLVFFFGTQDTAKVAGAGITFFDAAKNNNRTKLDSLSVPSSTQSDKDFTANLAKKAGANCSTDIRSIKISYTAGKPATATMNGYCDNKSQTWNFGLTKENGTWYIDKLVVDGSGSATTSLTPTTTSPCLTASEAAETGYTSRDFHADGYIFSDTYFFEPDSAAFVSDFVAIQNEDLDKFATWVKKYTDKSFMVNITPKVQEASLSTEGATLAKQRAEYVRDQLIQRGVKSSKIAIQAATAEADTTDTQSARRNVLAEIDGDASCAN